MANNGVLIPEMLVEILSRLPIKPLTRFKCVSKLWLSLINENLRWKLLPSNMVGFFYVRTLHKHQFYAMQDRHHHQPVDTYLHFLPMNFGIPEIVDSCNGLLLCRPMIIWTKSLFYYICNPATKRWDTLPSIHYTNRDFARLAFDPNVSCHYKVLLVKHCITHSEFYIFSSEHCHEGWKKHRSFQLIIKLDFYGRCCGLFSQGALYLASCCAVGSHIVRYCLLKGSLKMIMLPPGYARSPFIGILGGSICSAVLVGSRLTIWTLVVEHNNDGTWVLKDDIIVEESGAVSPAVAFHPRSEVVFVQTKQGFTSYDLSFSGDGAAVNIGGPESGQDERKVGVALPFTPCYTDALRETENKTKQEACAWCFIGFVPLIVLYGFTRETPLLFLLLLLIYFVHRFVM